MAYSVSDAIGGFDNNGNFKRVCNWTADKNAGIKILAERMDAECDNFAMGFDNCLTRDGRGVISSNFDFNDLRGINLTTQLESPFDAVNVNALIYDPTRLFYDVSVNSVSISLFNAYMNTPAVNNQLGYHFYFVCAHTITTSAVKIDFAYQPLIGNLPVVGPTGVPIIPIGLVEGGIYEAVIFQDNMAQVPGPKIAILNLGGSGGGGGGRVDTIASVNELLTVSSVDHINYMLEVEYENLKAALNGGLTFLKEVRSANPFITTSYDVDLRAELITFNLARLKESLGQIVNSVDVQGYLQKIVPDDPANPVFGLKSVELLNDFIDTGKFITDISSANKYIEVAKNIDSTPGKTKLTFVPDAFPSNVVYYDSNPPSKLIAGTVEGAAVAAVNAYSGVIPQGEQRELIIATCPYASNVEFNFNTIGTGPKILLRTGTGDHPTNIWNELICRSQHGASVSFIGDTGYQPPIIGQVKRFWFREPCDGATFILENICFGAYGTSFTPTGPLVEIEGNCTVIIKNCYFAINDNWATNFPLFKVSRGKLICDFTGTPVATLHAPIVGITNGAQVYTNFNYPTLTMDSYSSSDGTGILVNKNSFIFPR
jgi:hypothetical protein